MIKYILAVWILVTFTRCSYLSGKEKIRYLSNGGEKYWYRYHQDTLKPYSLGYCINKNGTFIRYFNPRGDRKMRIKDEYPPVHSKPIWKVINDTLIMFGKDYFYKIMFLNSDSIILKSINPGSDGYLKLHKDPDQNLKIIRGKY
jgi:hypothetical protein